jgi:hypothetical protein
MKTTILITALTLVVASGAQAQDKETQTKSSKQPALITHGDGKNNKSAAPAQYGVRPAPVPSVPGPPPKSDLKKLQ